MEQIKGTKTEKNLQTALAGESMARNKYDYYSSQAKKDGFVQISQIFAETAHNEKEHAKIWFKELHGGKIAPTIENLIDAAAGEHYEFAEMYKEFAEQAKEEGFNSLAAKFKLIGEIERTHEMRYKELLENIKKDRVFKKDETCNWKCLECGHITTSKEAPMVCPVCAHPQAYQKIDKRDY